MEFRWYIPPGKVLENTRIEERGHAIHVSKENWNKVAGHLDRNRLIQEAIDSEEAHKKHMRETSKAMTSTWTNSVENIRKRKEEERAKRVEAKADTNFIRFMELKKEQEEERKIYVAQVKKKMEMKKEYPVALTSALILSEVMFERGKQQELDKKLKKHYEDADKEYFEQIKINNQKAEEKGLLDEQKKKEKERQYGVELKASLLQRKLDQEREIKETQRNELENNEMNERELEEIKNCQHIKFLEKRTKQASDYKKFFEVQQIYKNKMKQDDLEAEAISKIIQESKEKIKGLTKLNEEEFKRKKQERAEEIAKLVAAERQNKDAAENAIIQRVAAEKEEIYQAGVQAKLDKRERQKKECQEAYDDDCRERAKKAYKEKEIQRWECVNRIKTFDEVAAAKKLEEESKSNRVNLVKDWNMQLEEKRQIEAEKEEERLKFDEEKAKIYVMDDEQFFQYAEDVREFAKEQGWITYPIDRVTAQYKEKVQLQPPPEKPCMHYKCPRRFMEEENLVNKTPGKMAHNPASDPNFSLCKCKCHKDPLLK